MEKHIYRPSIKINEGQFVGMLWDNEKTHVVFFVFCFCNSIGFPINYVHDPDKTQAQFFRGVDVFGEYFNKIRKSSRIDLQFKLIRENLLDDMT